MELLTTEILHQHPLVLKLDGEIDISTAGQLRAALEEAIAADPGVVVDMGGVSFFDAAGLRVVLEVAESLNGSGPLTLVNAARVARLLELVGLHDLPHLELRDAGARLGC
jgi:anti-sigma B factor antagonist